MTTSRTGTATWKRMRTTLIRTRDHICHWCGKPLDPKAAKGSPDAIELDHVVPVSLRPDLAHEPGNLALVCHPCNRSKGDREQPKSSRQVRVTCAFHNPITPTCPHSRAW